MPWSANARGGGRKPLVCLFLPAAAGAPIAEIGIDTESPVVSADAARVTPLLMRETIVAMAGAFADETGDVRKLPESIRSSTGGPLHGVLGPEVTWSSIHMWPSMSESKAPQVPLIFAAAPMDGGSSSSNLAVNSRVERLLRVYADSYKRDGGPNGKREKNKKKTNAAALPFPVVRGDAIAFWRTSVDDQKCCITLADYTVRMYTDGVLGSGTRNESGTESTPVANAVVEVSGPPAIAAPKVTLEGVERTSAQVLTTMDEPSAAPGAVQAAPETSLKGNAVELEACCVIVQQFYQQLIRSLPVVQTAVENLVGVVGGEGKGLLGTGKAVGADEIGSEVRLLKTLLEETLMLNSRLSSELHQLKFLAARLSEEVARLRSEKRFLTEVAKMTPLGATLLEQQEPMTPMTGPVPPPITSSPQQPDTYAKAANLLASLGVSAGTSPQSVLEALQHSKVLSKGGTDGDVAEQGAALFELVSNRKDAMKGGEDRVSNPPQKMHPAATQHQQRQVSRPPVSASAHPGAQKPALTLPDAAQRRLMEHSIYRVTQPFESKADQGSNTDQFARLSPGMFVVVEREDPSGWWWVSTLFLPTRIEGWFPYSYLEEVSPHQVPYSYGGQSHVGAMYQGPMHPLQAGISPNSGCASPPLSVTSTAHGVAM